MTQAPAHRRVVPSWLLPLVLPFVAFLALGAAALAPMSVTLADYGGTSSWGSWSLPATFQVDTGCVAFSWSLHSGSCLEINNAVAGDTASVSIPYIASGDTVNVTPTVQGPGSGYAAFNFKYAWDNAAGPFTVFGGADGAGASLVAPAGASHTLYLQIVVTTGGFLEVSDLTVVDATATQSSNPGTMSFPGINMTSLAADVQSYWTFIAPALYVVGGIGLGGLIVSKVRGLL